MYFLKILLHLLAKWNTKGLTVERFYQVLEKITTIENDDKKTAIQFTAIATVATFTCNNATIDNTDIIQSIIAICILLSFPSETELTKILCPALNPATDVTQYSKLVSNNHRFTTKPLKILFRRKMGGSSRTSQ